MTHFLLLNISIELTKSYGGVAKEDVFFIVEKNSLVTLLFTPIHKCLPLQRLDTRKKSDKFFPVQFK